eukprot:12467961-Alexandrium_andersonii.AAC.1
MAPACARCCGVSSPPPSRSATRSAFASCMAESLAMLQMAIMPTAFWRSTRPWRLPTRST